MKLFHKDLEKPFEFEKYEVPVIVFENQKDFRTYSRDIQLQVNSNLEDSFKLIIDNKSVDLYKQTICLPTPFDIFNSQSKIKNHLYKYLDELLIQEYSLITSTRECLREYINQVSMLSDIEISYDIDFSNKDLFKLFKINIELDTNNVLDSLISIIETISKFNIASTMIFFNLKHYLLSDELELLYKESLYNEVNLILFENSIESKIDYEKVFIVDSDSCQII